jgi:hypothetical protein
MKSAVEALKLTETFASVINECSLSERAARQRRL